MPWNKSRTCVSGMRGRACSSSRSVKVDVFVLDGEIVDAALGRRDPAGYASRLNDSFHQRANEGSILLRRDPVLQAPLVLGALDHLSVRVDRHAGPRPDRAAE